MSVDNISATNSNSGQSTTTTTTTSQLKDEFLSLLVAQIKNQDPLSPMDNTQYVAELSQFSSLEQLQDMNSSISQLITLQQTNGDNNYLLYATNMLGKSVEATDPDTNATYSGTVQGYQIENGEIYFTVDGQSIPASWISSTSLADSEAG